MRDQRERWSVRKCAVVCGECEKAFVHEQVVMSELQFREGSYERIDRCEGVPYNHLMALVSGRLNFCFLLLRKKSF